WDLLVDDALHQAFVLDGAHAVVDTLDLQQVEGFPDVLGWAFLASVRDGLEAFGAGALEDALELARRVALLGAVQAHGDEGIAKWQRLVEGLVCLLFAQVAQEAQDQPAADAQLFMAIPEGLADAA